MNAIFVSLPGNICVNIEDVSSLSLQKLNSVVLINFVSENTPVRVVFSDMDAAEKG